MKRIKGFLFLNLVLGLLAMSGCVNAPQQGTNNTANSSNSNGQTTSTNGKKIKIGFAMDTVKEERWQRDQAAFEAYCKKVDVECEITVADNKAEKQANDVDNLITKGVDVLVIAPHDATQAASMVDKAKAKGIPVISYDRLINSDKLDAYISHQVPVIGQKIAEYALQKVPKGNYVMVYGDAADNNALILKNEMLKVLKPAVDKGDIKIVADQNAVGWKAEESLKIVENALTQNTDKIDCVVASNDGTAGGAISALEKKGLAGKVVVTGQDAEKAALQRIAEGKQAMTIYKSIPELAKAAIDAAIKLAKKEPLTDAKPFKNDKLGKDVPAILLEVVTVDKDNLMATVIKDGWAKFEDVYANVPADQRPKQ